MITSDQNTYLLGMSPRFLNGVLEVPVYHMRGGTSTGIVLLEDHLPSDLKLREEIIKRIMGVPITGKVELNSQISGLGRGIPQSCKVFIVKSSERDDADIDSTLAQLAPTKEVIDWSVNCGNMSAALPIFAEEMGLLSLEPGRSKIRIHNTNTGVVAHALVDMPKAGEPMDASTEIPGVLGAWPGVQLALLNPVGAKTNQLLPTGNVVDIFDGIETSCLDLAVPMVIIRATDLSKTAAESPEDLDADTAFKTKLQRVWVEAGIKMGLTGTDGKYLTPEQLAVSETIPKACIISPPSEEEKTLGANIRVRYFTPQGAHKSLAVTGGACLAAGCLVPGTVAQEIAKNISVLGQDLAEHEVKMANPAGILKATIEGKQDENDNISMPSAAYERSTQILLRGHTPVYNASDALKSFYTKRFQKQR